MKQQERITTRELLRNFRGFKDLLLQGKVQHLVVEVGGDHQLEVSVRKSSNGAREIAQRFKRLPRPLHIERIDLFEALLEPHVPRR